MNAWEDAYDAQLERSQEDWMAEKRGERRCEKCDCNGLARLIWNELTDLPMETNPPGPIARIGA